jgi:N-acetylneuraminate synthase
MSLILNGKEQTLNVGDMVTVARGVKHSFSTETGVIFEEISTTDHQGDSYYDDDSITHNTNRKTALIFRADWINSEW